MGLTGHRGDTVLQRGGGGGREGGKEREGGREGGREGCTGHLHQSHMGQKKNLHILHFLQ